MAGTVLTEDEAAGARGPEKATRACSCSNSASLATIQIARDGESEKKCLIGAISWISKNLQGLL